MNRPGIEQQDPLNLSGLPMIEPPSDGWPAIETALKETAQASSKRRKTFAYLAVAATVTLAVGLYFQQDMSLLVESPTPGATEIVNSNPPAMENTTPTSENASGVTLAQLTIMSQELEKDLRLMRSGVGALPLDSAMYQIELEDLVAQVDDALSTTPDSKELWGQRVNLQMDLASLYRGQLRREYGQLASL